MLTAIVVASLGGLLACNAVLSNEKKSLEPLPLMDDPNAPGSPASCTDACPKDGAKRCSAVSSAGVEACGTSADGCLAWKQDADCAASTSCDTATDDGSCKAGCVNDDGCSANNVGATRCVLPSGPNGTAEQTCSASGACYQWATTRSNIPQECSVSGPYCALDVRKTCVASASGACTQHVSQANACAQGSVCQNAGQCTQAPAC